MPNFVGADLDVAFTLRDNRTGALVDPTSLTFRLTPPNGPGVDYYWSVPGHDDSDEITRTATGQFYFAFRPTVAGGWRGRWTSTGDKVTIEEIPIPVSPLSAF